MNNIRPTDMMILDNLFEMGGGYVLNFSNRTFSEFFLGEFVHAGACSEVVGRLCTSVQHDDKGDG